MAMIKSTTCALLLASSIHGVAGQIEAVDDFVVSKYLGRWTQLYGNTFSEATATRGLTCVGTFYGFDEPSGNITVYNFGRVGTPDGELSAITGYAYGTDENEPAQLKVSLTGVPFDGDYWIVGLGPDTFGPDELYQWAIVSGPPAEQLFILVRDVDVFEESYEEDVLAFVTGDLGFTGPEKEPQRIVQEGCLPIEVPGEQAEEPVDEIPLEQEDAQIEAVDDFDVSKYLGRWYQLYGNTFSEQSATRGLTCVGTQYGLDQPSGNITVFNFGRVGTPTGELSTITGYAYGTDENEPAQLKVSLAGVPFDSDYWIVGLGPATFGRDGLYQWAVVSGPTAEQLFILVRDVEVFESSYEEGVLAFVTGDLGFTGPEKEPQRIVQEGCAPLDPALVPDGKFSCDVYKIVYG